MSCIMRYCFILLVITTCQAVVGSVAAEPTSMDVPNAHLNHPPLFIHVGKCGGSFVDSWLKSERVHVNEVHLRYNYVRRVIETNVTGMAHCTLGPHCLAPFHIRHKIITGYAYTREFDRLVTSFSDANNLAESITASGGVGKTANTLMKIGIEHIAKGIGFYLQDGAWARKYSQQIFLGTLETMGPDLDRLAGVLGKSSAVLGGNLRKSSGSRGLSELARRNLYRYYNESDYAALRTLVELGLLKDGQYDLTPANGMPTPTTGVPT